MCVCVCVCSLLLGNPNFKDPYLLALVGECKVARVGRPSCQMVGKDHASHATFPMSDNYYVCVCVCVCVCVNCL